MGVSILSPNVTVPSVNIAGLVNETALATADKFIFFDASAGLNRKIGYDELKGAVLVLPDGFISSSKLASGAVVQSKLGSGSVGTPQLINGSVTSEKVASGVLTSAPIGCYIPFAGTVLPIGWGWCNGAAISRITYAGLFDVIGITYGAGDGVSTFNVPDLRCRTVIGLDGMGGVAVSGLVTLIDAETIGAVGGEQAHALSIGENASHAHSVSISGSLVTGVGSDGNFQGGGSKTGLTLFSSTPATASTGTSGSSSAHNNMQPSIVASFIIKY